MTSINYSNFFLPKGELRNLRDEIIELELLASEIKTIQISKNNLSQLPQDQLEANINKVRNIIQITTVEEDNTPRSFVYRDLCKIYLNAKNSIINTLIMIKNDNNNENEKLNFLIEFLQETNIENAIVSKKLSITERVCNGAARLFLYGKKIATQTVTNTALYPQILIGSAMNLMWRNLLCELLQNLTSEEIDLCPESLTYQDFLISSVAGTVGIGALILLFKALPKPQAVPVSPEERVKLEEWIDQICENTPMSQVIIQLQKSKGELWNSSASEKDYQEVTLSEMRIGNEISIIQPSRDDVEKIKILKGVMAHELGHIIHRDLHDDHLIPLLASCAITAALLSPVAYSPLLLTSNVLTHIYQLVQDIHSGDKPGALLAAKFGLLTSLDYVVPNCLMGIVLFAARMRELERSADSFSGATSEKEVLETMIAEFRKRQGESFHLRSNWGGFIHPPANERADSLEQQLHQRFNL